MTYSEQIKQSKEKHWGINCANWSTCQQIGLCNEICPSGGAAKEEGEADE